MKRYLQGAGAALMLGGLVLTAGCVAYGGGGAVYYDYDYYPDWDIYYYPHNHVYYWNEGGAWRSGERPPDRYDLHNRHSEQLHLHSQQPWTEHQRQRGGGEHPQGHEHDHN